MLTQSKIVSHSQQSFPQVNIWRGGNIRAVSQELTVLFRVSCLFTHLFICHLRINMFCFPRFSLYFFFFFAACFTWRLFQAKITFLLFIFFPCLFVARDVSPAFSMRNREKSNKCKTIPRHCARTGIDSSANVTFVDAIGGFSTALCFFFLSPLSR